MIDTGAEVFLDALCLAMKPSVAGTPKILRSIIDLYDTYKAKDDFFKDPIVKVCASIITDMLNDELDLENTADYSATILKLETHTKNNAPELTNKIRTLFETKDEISTRRITTIQKRLRLWVIYYITNKQIGNMFSNSNKCVQTTNEIRQELYLNNILTAARDLVKVHEDPDIGEDDIIEMIDMSDKESVRKAFNANKKKKTSGIIKTGLQGLNRMFGKNGGPLRGEFILFAGLSHHYKSGILMDMTRWIATLNNPGPCNGKIPAIVFISLENEAHENMMQWYRDAYKNMYHDSGEDLSDDDILDYLTDTFSKRGFKLLVFRRLGETFGYDEWAKLHIKLQNSGYYVVASVCDYMSKMKLEEGGVNDAKKRENLAGKMVNFCNHNSILGVSAIQLGPAAEELAGSGKSNIVKRYSAMHLADCKGLKKETDILIFLHIEINPLTGKKYLTMKKDKHRYEYETKEEDKYCAYEFIDKYGILDDIDNGDKSIKDIYAEDGNNNQSSALVATF